MQHRALRSVCQAGALGTERRCVWLWSPRGARWGLTALLTCQVRKASGWSLTGSAPQSGATTRSPSWTASTGSSPCAQVGAWGALPAFRNDVASPSMPGPGVPGPGRGRLACLQRLPGEVSVRIFSVSVLRLGQDWQPFPDRPPPPAPCPAGPPHQTLLTRPTNARAEHAVWRSSGFPWRPHKRNVAFSQVAAGPVPAPTGPPLHHRARQAGTRL